MQLDNNSKIIPKIPIIMGILNCTPDSFSDGGRFTSLKSQIQHAEQMVLDGAKIIDIGGESTRPGAKEASVQEECDRVLPVIEALQGSALRNKFKISIDTRKPQVALEAVKAGADFLNDVSALDNYNNDQIAKLAATEVPVCIMHMQNTPNNMQQNPSYTDVVQNIYDFFEKKINFCQTHGIKLSNIYIDPGFGFGKTLEHNLDLLANLNYFDDLGCKLLIGLSRKSMFKKMLGHDNPTKRIYGSIAAALLAASGEVAIIRTHDVWQTLDALKVYQAVLKFKR